jgi:hypothetical protein
MKKNLLMGASFIVLTIGANTQSFAADGQNTKIDHSVTDNNIGILSEDIDANSIRTNDLNNRSFNGATGIAHTMQNNGSNNAVSSADSVAVNPHNTLRQRGSNTADVSGNIGYDLGSQRSNDISDSFIDTRGVFSVQQNNGDNNSIAGSNQVLVRTSDDPIETRTETDQSVGAYNEATSTGGNRQNTIQNGSFRGAKGILNLQQNNGDNNAMAQTNAVGVGIRTTALDQRVTSTGKVASSDGGGSTAYDQGVTRSNTLTNAFQDAAGIMSVQQNNGSNNVMASTNAIGVTIDGLGTAAQAATLEATVSNAFSAQTVGLTPSSLTNSASGIMRGAKGVMTLQQNNGNNNVIQSVVMVSAGVTR